MKLAVARYAVRISKDGKAMFDGYYGYTSRKSAEARAEQWRKIGYETEIVDRYKSAVITD